MRIVGAFMLMLAAAPASAEVVAEQIDTAVLVRPVAAGEQLSVDDFAHASLPAALARGALAPEAAAGKELVRALPSGSAVRRYDVINPQLVRKGQSVTLLVRSDALRIEGRGKALSSGAMGDTVRAQLQGGLTLIEGEVVAAGVLQLGE